jgi:hypothetical protein
VITLKASIFCGVARLFFQIYYLQSQALTFPFFKFLKDFPLIFYNKLKIVYYKNLLLKKFKKTERFRPPPPFGSGKGRDLFRESAIFVEEGESAIP